MPRELLTFDGGTYDHERDSPRLTDQGSGPMNALEKLSQATRMLSEVRSADDAKKLMDMAAAAEYYASKAKLGEEAIGYAHTIRIDAMRLLGEFMKENPKNTGARGIGTSAVPSGNHTPPTLADLGLTKKESSQSQLLSKLANDAPKQFQAIRNNEKTFSEVSAELKRERKFEVAEQLAKEPSPSPIGPFRVIVADPPWKYGSRAEDLTHRARNPYPDMDVYAIEALPIPELAHQECVLWLWTTNAFMGEALGCLGAWGFEKKTILTWVKDRMGLGDWLRGQTEHCIMAVKGKPTVTLTNQTTALLAPVREHSRKPDEFYCLVESLCPGNKLEMFARQHRDGWQSWGPEASLFDAK
jgi:N6-adenosine-specific RNA methylase IME4